MDFITKERTAFEKQIIKFAIKFQPNLIKAEIFFLLILLVGLILVNTNQEIGTHIITISLSILSIMYFIMAYKGDQFENKFDSFLIRLIYWSYSTGIVGILFSIQRWPGAYMMLTVGLSTMTLGLIGIIIIKNKNRIDKKMINSDFLRTLIILLIGAGFLLYGNLKEIDNQKRIINQEIVE